MLLQITDGKRIKKTTKLTLSFRRTSADRAGEPPRGVTSAGTCSNMVRVCSTLCKEAKLDWALCISQCFEVAALDTHFFLERVFAHAMIWQIINEKPITKTTKLTLSFRRASADRAGEPPRGVASAETCPEFV